MFLCEFFSADRSEMSRIGPSRSIGPLKSGFFPHALTCQLSTLPDSDIQGGTESRRRFDKAYTYGSYDRRISFSLRSTSAPSCRRMPSPLSRACRAARSAAGRRSVSGSRGGVCRTRARSTTTCRAMAKVNWAWRKLSPTVLDMTNEQVSRTAVSAASQDWLSCWERK